MANFKRKEKNNFNVSNLIQFKKKSVGRRIIDMDYFGRQFDRGCEKCKSPLSFDIIQETVLGLCSIFRFRCKSCKHETKIASSDTCDGEGKTPYSINAKVALGMIHAGIGETHVNSVLTTLGLPGISQPTLKKLERRVGSEIEREAKRSCAESRQAEYDIAASQWSQKDDEITFDEAIAILETPCGSPSKRTNDLDVHVMNNNRPDGDPIQQELEIGMVTEVSISEPDVPVNIASTSAGRIYEDRTLLQDYVTNNGDSVSSSVLSTSVESLNLGPCGDATQQKHGVIDRSEVMEVTVSQDAGWSKRGKAMNSLSGWGHVIGHETKRCLDYCTRIKGCKKCSHYSRIGQEVPSHDCRKNWDKSSKAMEADIAVELHQNGAKTALVYSKVIGDEDSSSIYHIRNKVNPNVEKYSDLSHIKRSISRRLDELQKHHKELTGMVKNDFIKNFAYAVRQNTSGTEESMIQSLRAVVEHMFGSHEECGQWCRYGKVDIYKHSGLPYGKDLKSESLRSALHHVLSPFVQNPKRFITDGSTQPNESLNSVAWSKAPKFRNYNMSESFDYRCAAGVLQFNEGVSYVDSLCNQHHRIRSQIM